MHTFYYNISDFEKTKVIEPVSSVISRHHIQAPVYDKHNILIGELSSINHHKIIDGKNTITTQTYLKTNKGVLGFSVFYETSNIIELYIIIIIILSLLYLYPLYFYISIYLLVYIFIFTILYILYLYIYYILYYILLLPIYYLY